MIRINNNNFKICCVIINNDLKADNILTLLETEYLENKEIYLTPYRFWIVDKIFR